MDNLRDKAAPAPIQLHQATGIVQLSKESAITVIISNQWAPGYSCLFHQDTVQHPVGVSRALTENTKGISALLPYCHLYSRLVLPTAQEGPTIPHTYRQICIKVVFSVKQGLLVYAAVESQACHHCCFHTSPIKNLRKHDTQFCSDTQYVTNTSPTHCLIRSIYSISLGFSHHQISFCCVGSSYSSFKLWKL